MNTAIVIALIALAGSILSTIVTVFGAPALQARRDAKKARDTYREPLLAASYELQARLYIRREVQYLRFSRDRQTRDIGRLLQDIGETFLSDKYGSQFMIWRVEQRGLGERMIESADNKMTCLGYASMA